MPTVRKAGERGHANHGWLDTYHTFSFAAYQDPDHVRFRSLRVMNEDWVAGGRGFGTHPHQNMEIVTYVLEGALEHRDSMGNGEVLRPGEFQRMSAGTGITHSEFNPSEDTPVHLYQIWLTPKQIGLEPSYQQKQFDETQRQGRLQLVASPNGQDGSLSIHQDVRIHLADLSRSDVIDVAVEPSRGVWIQVLRGEVRVGEQALAAGDGWSADGPDVAQLRLSTDSGGEVMLFDMA